MFLSSMLGFTHVLFALFLSLLFVRFSSFDALFVLFVLIGSLLPDIDESSSIIGRKFKLVGWLSRHRGFFHSFYFMLLVAVLFWFWSELAAFAFVLGFLSHLFLDSLTRGGVSPFLTKKRFKGLLKTNSLVEKIIVLVLLCLNIYLTIVVL